MMNTSQSTGALQQTRSPRGATATSDLGLEFVGSVSADIKSIKNDMLVFQDNLVRLKNDIAAEAQQRGGEIAGLQQRFYSDLTAQISQVKVEWDLRHANFEEQTKKWAGAL